MQTRLICHYNGKWPISLTDVSKLLMTLITPILLPKLSVLILLSRVLNSSSWRTHTKKEFDSFIKALKFFSVPFQVTIKMKIKISSWQHHWKEGRMEHHLPWEVSSVRKEYRHTQEIVNPRMKMEFPYSVQHRGQQTFPPFFIPGHPLIVFVGYELFAPCQGS